MKIIYNRHKSEKREKERKCGTEHQRRVTFTNKQCNGKIHQATEERHRRKARPPEALRAGLMEKRENETYFEQLCISED